MARMGRIVIVATVRCLDLGANPLLRSAETTRKCGKDYGYFCQKRSGKTNKNLHPLLPRNMPSINNSSSSSIISICNKQVIELHQRRHQPHQMLGPVNQNQDPKAKNLHLLYQSIPMSKKSKMRKHSMNSWISSKVIKNLQTKR